MVAVGGFVANLMNMRTGVFGKPHEYENKTMKSRFYTIIQVSYLPPERHGV